MLGFIQLLFFGLDDYVVNIDLDVSPNLLSETVLHHSLVGGTRVLEPEGHCCVTVDAERRDECCFVFVFFLHLDLVVARIGIQEGQALTACR